MGSPRWSMPIGLCEFVRSVCPQPLRVESPAPMRPGSWDRANPERTMGGGLGACRRKHLAGYWPVVGRGEGAGR